MMLLFSLASPLSITYSVGTSHIVPIASPRGAIFTSNHQAGKRCSLRGGGDVRVHAGEEMLVSRSTPGGIPAVLSSGNFSDLHPFL